MKPNLFLRQTIDTYNHILLEFDRAFMELQRGYDSYNDITNTYNEELYDYVSYSNPLENFKIQLGDVRKMSQFLIRNYPRLIESEENALLKAFNILVFQSEELVERVENFLIFEPHVKVGSTDSAKNTTAHFDLIACSSVKILASINKIIELISVSAAA